MDMILSILERIGQIMTDHAEAVVALAALYYSYRQNSRDKQVENYLTLKSEFRSLWGRITSFPGETSVLLTKDIQDFKGEAEEDMKLVVYQVLDLFDDVFYYFQQSRQNIKKTDWHKQMKFVFSNKLFVTGFKKHKTGFSDEFVEYVEIILAQAEQEKEAAQVKETEF